MPACITNGNKSQGFRAVASTCAHWMVAAGCSTAQGKHAFKGTAARNCSASGGRKGPEEVQLVGSGGSHEKCHRNLLCVETLALRLLRDEQRGARAISGVQSLQFPSIQRQQYPTVPLQNQQHPVIPHQNQRYPTILLHIKQYTIIFPESAISRISKSNPSPPESAASNHSPPESSVFIPEPSVSSHSPP